MRRPTGNAQQHLQKSTMTQRPTGVSGTSAAEGVVSAVKHSYDQPAQLSASSSYPAQPAVAQRQFQEKTYMMHLALQCTREAHGVHVPCIEPAYPTTSDRVLYLFWGRDRSGVRW